MSPWIVIPLMLVGGWAVAIVLDRLLSILGFGFGKDW